MTKEDNKKSSTKCSIYDNAYVDNDVKVKDHCYISNRYSNSNNWYLKYYYPKQESKHTIYLDANNLYGYTMSRFLPTDGFKWIDPKEFDFSKYTSNSSKRCVLEVDLEYQK